MIELFEQDIRTNDRQSSKGNQLKWENEGMWYKADYAGYEGLAEYMISHLLEQSSLSPSEYALYNLEQIKYKSSIYCGVKSRSFLQRGWQIITLERLFKNFSGESLYKSTYKIGSHEERMIFLVEQVERITGLTEFGKYLNKLFTIDALFLNEDRHMHNIAVLMNGKGEFAYCPIFDNGAGLLSDTTMDYPINDDIYQLMDNVQSKTICSDFDEQLDISEALYGENIRLVFSEKDVQRLLEKADIYPEQQKNRVETIIRTQMRKYRYLFSI
ncbi:MAG: hypothetical protein SPJ81_12670 [Lachnoclostridium sp.]|nr:hypothetical protein [Lachnoclostridium sp.]